MSAARAVRVTSMFEPQDNEPWEPDAAGAAWPFLPFWAFCGAGGACAPPLGLTSNVCATAGTAIQTREQKITGTIFFTGPPKRQFTCPEHSQAQFQLLCLYPAANQPPGGTSGPVAAQMWYAGTLCEPVSTHAFRKVSFATSGSIPCSERKPGGCSSESKLLLVRSSGGKT